ncbi:MAG TPA: N-acetylmuramoyl-L-alanine amidase [Anaerolineae bacterium]|nr:N-acetylmuramoyl-L-alanine amidase [Anaerolineae bacterium]
MIEPPEIAYIAESLPRRRDREYPRRRAITRVIIHHSAAPARIGAARIAAYHVRHGWPGIGYHFVITADGTIQQPQPLYLATWHTAGYNRASLGICLLGNFMRRLPPTEQLGAAAHLCAWLMEAHDLPASAIVGHRDLNRTACPGRTWQRWGLHRRIVQYAA